jgi:hypothetical protein
MATTSFSNFFDDNSTQTMSLEELQSVMSPSSEEDIATLKTKLEQQAGEEGGSGIFPEGMIEFAKICTQQLRLVPMPGGASAFHNPVDGKVCLDRKGKPIGRISKSYGQAASVLEVYLPPAYTKRERGTVKTIVSTVDGSNPELDTASLFTLLDTHPDVFNSLKSYVAHFMISPNLVADAVLQGFKVSRYSARNSQNGWHQDVVKGIVGNRRRYCMSMVVGNVTSSGKDKSIVITGAPVPPKMNNNILTDTLTFSGVPLSLFSWDEEIHKTIANAWQDHALSQSKQKQKQNEALTAGKVQLEGMNNSSVLSLLQLEIGRFTTPADGVALSDGGYQPKSMPDKNSITASFKHLGDGLSFIFRSKDGEQHHLEWAKGLYKVLELITKYPIPDVFNTLTEEEAYQIVLSRMIENEDNYTSELKGSVRMFQQRLLNNINAYRKSQKEKFGVAVCDHPSVDKGLFVNVDELAKETAVKVAVSTQARGGSRMAENVPSTPARVQTYDADIGEPPAAPTAHASTKPPVPTVQLNLQTAVRKLSTHGTTREAAKEFADILRGIIETYRTTSKFPIPTGVIPLLFTTNAAIERKKDTTLAGRDTMTFFDENSETSASILIPKGRSEAIMADQLVQFLSHFESFFGLSGGQEDPAEVILNEEELEDSLYGDDIGGEVI